MKILVAGRSGQVARALCEMERDDVEIVAVGRPDFDLRDADDIRAAIDRHRPDIAMNAAAYTQVDLAESHETEAFAVNAAGAANIASACASRDVPLIHLSTDYVFDGTSDRPYREDDATGPANAYGRSKLAGEREVAARCGKHLIVRTSWVFSPYGSNFLLTMLRLAATRPHLNVVADQIGAPTCATDLGGALVALARQIKNETGSPPWGVFHMTAAGETTWHGFAQAIFAEARALGWPAADVVPIGTADYPTPARRPRNSRLDGAKLRETFGIALPDWRSGLSRTMAQLARSRSS